MTIEIPVPTGARKLNEPVKAISTKGVSCSAADKFIKLSLTSTTGVVPEHYKCKSGHFKVPVGYVAQVCIHGAARIQYAQHGG